ncbi:MAG: hypothetical protein WAS32_04130, partial [Tabrizicola sp.]
MIIGIAPAQAPTRAVIRRSPRQRKAICRRPAQREGPALPETAIPLVGKMQSRLDCHPDPIRCGAFDVSDLILLVYRSQSAAFVA